MERIRPEGVYQAVFQDEPGLFPYKIGFLDVIGTTHEAQDAYSFPVQITDFDLQLLNEGNFLKSYEKMGAILTTVDGVSGVHMSVWAPNAKAVSVVGDFNHWRPGTHPMERVHFSGVWALFLPGLKKGDLYKFAVKGCDGEIRVKSDPYGYEAEVRPETASKVTSLAGYRWHDSKWLEARRQWNYLREPVSVYE